MSHSEIPLLGVEGYPLVGVDVQEKQRAAASKPRTRRPPGRWAWGDLSSPPSISCCGTRRSIQPSRTSRCRWCADPPARDRVRVLVPGRAYRRARHVGRSPRQVWRSSRGRSRSFTGVAGSSTALLEIILIGPIGLILAALAFVVGWGLAVVGQWASAHLYGVASGAASPSTLCELSQHWWTAHDATVREALAQNWCRRPSSNACPSIPGVGRVPRDRSHPVRHAPGSTPPCAGDGGDLPCRARARAA